MGGSSKRPRESNAARNTRMLAEAKSGQDSAAIRAGAIRAANGRKRSPLIGGPETFIGQLGTGSAMLGVNG